MGSPLLVSSSQGSIDELFTFDAFGVAYSGKFTGRSTVGYNGKMFDSRFSLYNYGYRDYAPRLGTWTTSDPLRDGTNWYAYCGQDPVNFIDLLGLCGEEADQLFFGRQDWGLGYDVLPKVKTVAIDNPALNFGAGVLGETWNLAATVGNFGFTIAGAIGEPVLGAVGWVDEQAKQYLGTDLATTSIILNQVDNEYAALGSSLTDVLATTSQYAKVAVMSRWGGLLNSTSKIVNEA